MNQSLHKDAVGSHYPYAYAVSLKSTETDTADHLVSLELRSDMLMIDCVVPRCEQLSIQIRIDGRRHLQRNAIRQSVLVLLCVNDVTDRSLIAIVVALCVRDRVRVRIRIRVLCIQQADELPSVRNAQRSPTSVYEQKSSRSTHRRQG